MPNVKPGDMAVILKGVSPHEFQGAQCYVEGPFMPRNLEEMFAADSVPAEYGSIWAVKMLQTVHVGSSGYRTFDLRTCKAGTVVGIPDKFLRRIDPPKEAEDVFSNTPTDEEILQSMASRYFKEKVRA